MPSICLHINTLLRCSCDIFIQNRYDYHPPERLKLLNLKTGCQTTFSLSVLHICSPLYKSLIITENCGFSLQFILFSKENDMPVKLRKKWYICFALKISKVLHTSVLPSVWFRLITYYHESDNASQHRLRCFFPILLQEAISFHITKELYITSHGQGGENIWCFQHFWEVPKWKWDFIIDCN